MATNHSNPLSTRVGSFRYFHADERWEWSDTVARMHGYSPGSVVPTTAVVMAHKHPDEACRVALVIKRMTGGEPFSSRHRIVDTAGATRPVLVVGDRLVDARGTFIGTDGFYVDLTDFDDAGCMDAAVAEFASTRACIEQAKGMLMVTYGIDADRAFDILVWRSQDTNTKVRELASQLVADFAGQLKIDARMRKSADHLLLTAHTRVNGHREDVYRNAS
ncbi:PAS and ANTAR domain-containing protein [Mycolicibacterium mengxianglii]|uniref:PAS and ANTAR domain-containing protein n=1 Tax=Mycolicibacterium mengxianglii TaxID=2736649 RepID=UPI0018EEEAFB|nr:PAS and ANTAR domain-containing protein [Mycolicibacterium mengxianglii]